MKKVSSLQCTLTVISVVSILVSNIIVNKQVQLPFGIVVSGGLFTFPISYILSDVFSEVYGYKWSRYTCYLTFVMNLFMVICFTLTLQAPSAECFTNQAAFTTVLGNTPRILAASLIAYVVGDYLNDIVFQRMKNKANGLEGFKQRAFVSSVIGSLADTTIFGLIAFIGQLSIPQILLINLSETVLKFIYELMVLPLTAYVVTKIKKYEEQ